MHRALALRLGAIYELPFSLQALEVGGATRERHVPARLLLGVGYRT